MIAGYKPLSGQVIRQIIPATGSRAKFTDSDGDVWTTPVVCWALVDIYDDEDMIVYQNIYGVVTLDAHPDDEGKYGIPYLEVIGIDDEGSGKFLGYE